MNAVSLPLSTPASASASQAGMASARGDRAGDPAGDSEFAQLLEPGPRADATARPAAEASARGEAPSGDAGERSETATSKDSRAASVDDDAPAPETAATDSTTAAKPASTADDDSDGNDDWPPPGLAALGLPFATLPPAPVAEAPGAAALLPAAAAIHIASDPARWSAQAAGTAGAADASAAQAPAPALAALLPALAAPADAAAASLDTAPLEWGAQLSTDSGSADGIDTAPQWNPLPALAAPMTLRDAGALAAAMPAVAPNVYVDGFAEDFGTQLSWMAEQKIGHAHIRISPQDLGPVEVRLRLDGDKVSADFASAQPEVRHALEHSLPRLREMLSQHGFQLAHADVGQQQRHGDGSPTPRGNFAAAEDTAATEMPTPSQVSAVSRRGLLDAYA